MSNYYHYLCLVLLRSIFSTIILLARIASDKACLGAVLLSLCSIPLAAQGPLALNIKVQSAENQVFEAIAKENGLQPVQQPSQYFCYEITAKDSVAARSSCEKLVRNLRNRGYLTASIDMFEQADSTFWADLHIGPLMRWTRLRVASNVDRRWLESAGFREKTFTGKAIVHTQLIELQENILQAAENNGYPFAVVSLDSVALDSTGAVSALLRLERNRFFHFGVFKVQGDARLPKSFWPNYLGIQRGQPYSRAQVLRIREQMSGLLFVENTASPSVRFAGDAADINLYLKKRRNSRFDFIIGLLPQPERADQASRLLLTGSLNAAFLNALNMAERIAIEFERLRPETQKLDVQSELPYLLGTPFGVAGRLNVFKRDSTWVDAQADFGVQYLLAGGNYVKFFWENRSSSLQKVDTVAIRLNRRLPPNLDLRQNGFGLESVISRLDYRFNPRRGFFIQAKGVAGFNNVLKNNQIESLRDPDFNYATLYDSVAGRSTRFRLETRVEAFLPLAQRSTIKFGFRGGGIFSTKPVFNNEQYRLGGNKLLRGFDEESLFATRWGMATLEYRLLLAQNSFLSVFSDYAYIENITNRNRLFLRPLGLGAGMNVETGAGIFGLSLAIGRRDAGLNLDFRSVKFHIGYVSLF